jgi:hypothetical protein
MQRRPSAPLLSFAIGPILRTLTITFIDLWRCPVRCMVVYATDVPRGGNGPAPISILTRGSRLWAGVTTHYPRKSLISAALQQYVAGGSTRSTSACDYLFRGCRIESQPSAEPTPSAGSSMCWADAVNSWRSADEAKTRPAAHLAPSHSSPGIQHIQQVNGAVVLLPRAGRDSGSRACGSGDSMRIGR